MDFIRKKIKGQKAATRKTWLSPEGYRISWRSEVCFVSVPPAYQASVRMMLPAGEIWDMVDRNRSTYKTMKAAEQACEKHYKLWMKACQAGKREFKNLVGNPLGTPVFIND
jgi:hypothetical protein